MTDKFFNQKLSYDGNGLIFEAQIPESQLIQQTISTSTEQEYLIRFSVGGFTLIP